ncbi:hypothetical protein GCM10009843_02620 [Nocardioides bigeumensis]|uniref:GerMN domain-containing protein n=2 Tax=Nocardioides bigeumensis TaxID=433657 RepID=A0ABN2XMM8_9ACTN
MTGGTRRGRTWVVVSTMVVATCAACGLPGSGSVTRVDDATIPYQLLEPDSGEPGPTVQSDPEGSGALTFWLVEDALVPEPAGASCADPPHVVARQLLDELVAGPSERARATGRSTAVAPDTELVLVDLADATAVIGVDPGATLSPDRLPVAIGQIVLTVTTAPGVRSVEFASGDEPVQVPLPDGVLTSGPVTAADYAALVPERFDASQGLGCPGA